MNWQENCLARRKDEGHFLHMGYYFIMHIDTCIECLGKYCLLQFISFLSKPTKDRLSDWEASNSLDRNDLYNNCPVEDVPRILTFETKSTYSP